nr:methyl-accepting chemotaxis protein [uncultured Noviherbaspirillum sp.]
MKLSNLRIGMRLGLGFVTVLAFLVIVAVLGLQRMGQIQSRLTEITDVNNVQIKLATTLRVTVYERAIANRNLVLLTEAADMQPEVDRIRGEEKKFSEAAEALSRMFASSKSTTQEEKTLMEKITASERLVTPLINKAAELGLANKAEEATTFLIKELRPVQRQLINQVGELIALETKLNQEAASQAAVAYESARMLMIGTSVLAVALGALLAWLTARSITAPINTAVRIAQTVAAGNLTSQITVSSKDETGQLLRALKDMNESLVKIVGEVRTGTDTIATATSQIAAGNMDLSSRTEQQASSLEETASSMEELTSTVKQNADNARQANQLAMSASDVAVRGGAVVSQVVDTMSAINDSAKKIVDIIGVIDGIAFQTNILALNAAVEAARAGEQGRGFAVVATEVRSLAQRSAAAAKEIKTLIGDSVEKVDAGSKLVAEAGSTMHEVVSSVKRVTDMMGEITAASQEQSAGIEQVNQAVSQMDQVTQQNAALVEEAAAAAESLQEQSSRLAQAVSVFQLDRNQTAVTAVTPAPASGHLKGKATPALSAPHSRSSVPSRMPAPLREKATATSATDGWEEF